MSSRWLSVLIAVGCLVVAFSGGVAAEPFVDLDPDTNLNGDGTTTSPYQITNASELQAMGGNLSANYTLMGTIEAGNTSAWNGGAGFEPIGNDTYPFTGTFSGSGETIQDVYINRTTDEPVGLFGATDGAEIERVGLTDVTIVGNASAGETVFVGGLVGNMSGTVTNVSVTGTVNGSNTVGGLVGNLNGTVSNSYANSSVDGGSQVGGLVGINANDGNINTSYAIGAVNESGSATAAGGLVGNNSGAVTDSYWDTESTGQPDDAIGGGLPTEQMTGNNATADMDGFDFYDHWLPTESYPVLTWQFFAESTGGGDGSESKPFVVSDEYGLQAIAANLTASYELASSIDASDTEQWNDGAGFEPIANGSQFSGSIDGSGNTIRNLTINRSDGSTPEVGLFSSVSSSGSINGLHLSDSSITGNLSIGGIAGVLNGTVTDSSYDGVISGVARVGGLIGLMETDGSVTDVRVTGSITVLNQEDTTIPSTNPEAFQDSTESPFGVGGLIGENTANVSQATTDVSITVKNTSKVGGLVGVNSLHIESSQSNGSITVDSGDDVGGIFGFSGGSSDRPFSNLSATVNITAVDSSNVGGLIGRTTNAPSNNPTEFENTSAQGAVTGNERVGGLLGNGGEYTVIRNSSATGTVSGSTDVGGLVGRTQSDIFRSFATGDVQGNTTSGNNVGGLVGYTNGPTHNSSASGSVSGNDTIGGLVGKVDTGQLIYSSLSVSEVSGNGSFAGEVANNVDIRDSYFDNSTSGVSEAVGTGSAAGITGFSKNDLQGSAAIANTNLSFNPVWIATDGYPIHVWRVDDYSLSLSDTDIDDDETADSTVALSLSDGTTQTATEPADYTSNDSSVATVNGGGKVTGVDAGSTQITAEASGFDDRMSLSVSLAPTTGSSSSSSSSSSSTDDEPEPDPEPEPETEDEDDSTDSPLPSTETDESSEPPTEEEEETEPVQSMPIITPMRVLGGGAAAVGSYVAVVLLSRTELFATVAPAAITKAVASVPGAAGMLLAEPEQAAFVVGSTRLAVDEDDDADNDSDVDVVPGELLAIEATIQNKGDVPGTRVVSLSLDDREDDTPLDLDAHTAAAVILEYQTTPADAGKTLGFTISCETDSADIDITVGDQPPEDDSMSETTHTADDDRTADDQPAETTAAESAGDADADAGEPVAPEGIGEDDEIDAEADEDELDAGTRTGVVDRLWMQKGKILSYTAGILVIYIGLTNFANNRLAGGLGIFLGVMALPIVRAQLPTATRVWISRYGKVLVVIIAALFSGVIVEPAVVFEAIERLFGL